MRRNILLALALLVAVYVVVDQRAKALESQVALENARIDRHNEIMLMDHLPEGYEEDLVGFAGTDTVAIWLPDEPEGSPPVWVGTVDEILHILQNRKFATSSLLPAQETQ